ncbi:MAG: energy transducer TonB [Prevotellaceae bacterium]|nr:energy transducer TonB [Prevotellaceae bacterium]
MRKLKTAVFLLLLSVACWGQPPAFEEREAFSDNGEPVGMWIKNVGGAPVFIDYDFSLNYSDAACPADGLPDKLRFFLFDDKSLGYIAPCIESGERDFSAYFHKHIFLPYDSLCKAATRPQPQRVIVQFTISETGKTENIAIVKGSNSLLYDKEAVRLVRALLFSNPAYLNGKPTEICVRYPVLFDTRLFCK